MQLGTPKERLQASLDEVVGLLQKHRVLETIIQRQEGSRKKLLEHLQHQQNLVELQTRCRRLHPADLAFILESLPLDDRALVWRQAPTALRGPVLVDVPDPVRESLIEVTDRGALVEALRTLPPDDLSFLEDKVSGDVWRDVSAALPAGELARLEEAVAFDEDSVGAVMAHDVAAVRDQWTVSEALTDLRSRAALPAHLDEVGVVDARNVLRGIVPMSTLLRQPVDAQVGADMITDPIVFTVGEPIEAAARAFERYGLVSAPVIDERGKFVGRVTAEIMIDYIRAAGDRAALAQAGLSREEDVFAPVLDSARNRWPWLMVNLCTAFLASRVIGAFEHTIGQLVALATLMPIVASIGGNTGNQTMTLVIRGLALERLQSATYGHLMRKELTVSLLNGLLWGSVMGLFALAIYHSAMLGLVMMAAVLLNLVIAAVVGVAVPIALQRAGRDPAQGASVLLTFVTDSMGFFLFLGLAQLFLL